VAGHEGTAAMAMVMPRHVAAVVPFAHHEAFGRLSPDQKERVSFLLQLFGEMATAPDGIVASADRLAALHPARGCSAPNLIRLYYKFRALEKRERGTGWRALAKIYKGPEKLPADFVQEVKRRIEKNSKGARAALTALKDEWSQGASIPGYGTWREYHATRWPERDLPERYPFGFFPEGWSESNLYTKQSSRAQRALVRHGYSAMKRYIPSVIRDTSNLRPLQLITIDDFELDFLVRAFNPVRKRWEICRAAGLLAIDVATRRKLAVALVPRFKLSKKERASIADRRIVAHADVVEGEGETAEEKRTRVSICREDVQSLLHVVFSTHGLPVDYGCTILCENAAAAITEDFERSLELLLGVQVARTGLIDEKTLRNGFVQGGGKPWEKGWIESLFNLIWGALGSLPGQKGSDYTKKPADHEAKVAYAMGLFKQCALAPEVADQLRVSFLTIDEALDGLNAVFHRIEHRTDHRMIGFEQYFDYQLPDQAGLLPETALRTLSQEQILAATPIPRMESPAERWARLMPTVRRVAVADYVLACLLLTPRLFTLKNYRLTTGKDGGLTFADADSPVMKLAEGTELLGYYDGPRATRMHVTDLKGRYLGTVRRRGAVDILDHDAISAEAGQIERLVRSCVIGEVRERHAAEDAQLGDDRAHNQALLEQHGLAEPLPAEAAGAAGQTPAAQKRGTVPTGLSSKLAQAPARDAFAAHREALAQGIAAHVGEQDAAQARTAAVRAQAEALTPEDLQAFGTAPATRLPATPAEPEQTFKDYE
jgi:hypothetical protein